MFHKAILKTNSAKLISRFINPQISLQGRLLCTQLSPHCRFNPN